MAIDRRTAGEQAAEQIRRMVWEGELAPGQRLNQEELAERLGVSRIPVREALLQLEGEGLIEMTPHRGAFVARLGEEDVRDHYALYGLVYGFALRRSIERGDPDLRDRLLELATELCASRDPGVVQAAMSRLLGAAASYGASPRVRAVARGLSGLVPGNFFAEVDGSVAAAHRGVTAIARAIEAGDAEGADAACVAMMQTQGERVIRVLRSRGQLDGAAATVDRVATGDRGGRAPARRPA